MRPTRLSLTSSEASAVKTSLLDQQDCEYVVWVEILLPFPYYLESFLVKYRDKGHSQALFFTGPHTQPRWCGKTLPGFPLAGRELELNLRLFETSVCTIYWPLPNKDFDRKSHLQCSRQSFPATIVDGKLCFNSLNFSNDCLNVTNIREPGSRRSDLRQNGKGWSPQAGWLGSTK